MSGNIDRQKLEDIVWTLAMNLTSGAIGTIPGGFIISAAFNTVIGQFNNELEQLRAELEGKIQQKIESYASDRLADNLTGLSDRLATYVADGKKTADIVSLNLALEQEEAGFLGRAHAETLRWLPLTLGFMFIRVVVWDEIEGNSELGDINVKNQVEQFVLRAMPLIVRLIQKGTNERIKLIELRIETPMMSPNVRNIDVLDGNVPLYHGVANALQSDQFNAAKAEANEFFQRRQASVQEATFNELSEKYFKPLQNIATLYDIHMASITSKPNVGPGFSLSDQYGDAYDLVVPDGAYVTGMSLFKHQNNVAIQLRYQALLQDGELDGKTYSILNSDLRKTTPVSLNNQYADTKMVMCPPGKAVIGARFYKHHNNLAIEIQCRPLISEFPQENTESVKVDKLGGPAPRLEHKYASTYDLDAPAGQVVIGCRMHQVGNQIHLEIVSAPTAAVLEGIDFRSQHL